MLVVNGTENITISATQNNTTVASAAETLTLNVELSAVGMVGIVSDQGGHHPLMVFT